jgi:DNA repair protein RadD
MLLVPRDYQEAAHDSLYQYFRTHTTGNPLIAMPTGSGKAVVIAMFVERALKWFPGTRIMVLTHVKELIQQNFEKLKAMWPHAPAGVYSSGLGKREHHYPVTFAGIGSVHKRTAQFGHIDLILIDEAHLVGDKDSAMYLSFLAKVKAINPQLKIIGLTATKYRVGMGMLTNGKIFDDVCFDLTDLTGFNWLLNQGYLKPLVPQPMELEYDLSEVHTQNGEYKLNELQDAMDRTDLNRLAVREMAEKAHARKHWLVFASGVSHCIHISDLLDEMGIRSVAIHTKMGDDARDEGIAAFKAGQYQVAVNFNVLTTGFDFPEIDCIGVLRASKSPGLWVQMLGRGTRPVYAKGPDLKTRDGRLEAIWYGGAKDCLVLDFARNTPRLGPINDPVLPRQKGSGGGGGDAPVKICPACGTYVHASLTVCPYCSAEMPRQLKIAPTAGTMVLIKTEEVIPKAPVIETLDVIRVTYQRHSKPGKPDSIRVHYYTSNGFRRFEEWVCLEHEGTIRHRARDWWRRRAGYDQPVPETTDAALSMLYKLQEPKQIRVRTDMKYPEIVGHDNFIQPGNKTLADALGG